MIEKRTAVNKREVASVYRTGAATTNNTVINFRMLCNIVSSPTVPIRDCIAIPRFVFTLKFAFLMPLSVSNRHLMPEKKVKVLLNSNFSRHPDLDGSVIEKALYTLYYKHT